MFRNNASFYGEELSSPRPTTLSAVRDYIFNIFAATHHIGGRSSIRNLRKRHAVVTRTHLSRAIIKYLRKKWEYNEAVHQLFLNFRRAYDDLSRREILYNIFV